MAVVFDNKMWVMGGDGYDENNNFGSHNDVWYSANPVCNGGVDVGLRINDGNGVIKIAAEPTGTLTSPLRIFKSGTIHGIVLVDPSDPNASRLRIRTSTATKALCRLP